MELAAGEIEAGFGEYECRFGEYVFEIGEYVGWFGEYGSGRSLEMELSLCKKGFCGSMLPNAIPSLDKNSL
ncbi:hypothetical protein LRR81_13375 [Metabacillus sp. GX 13764]|uniref:hypothetical protein n=1 Tax=Metabacillus kandeliae TaxID=2900151 RepID=UPI001E2B548D|nr:hypothetical protein [Metabacillus kandeliae]MCD7035232.1 hypothetical protein [Metabacillus kandeliae]